jgi:hypothetical protein
MGGQPDRRDREQAEVAVRSDKLAGYIAIKVYNRLSKDAYEAIVAAAKQQGLPVVGHVPTEVGLWAAIAAGQHSIEHLTGFFLALQPDDSSGMNKSLSELAEHADLKKLSPLVRAIKAADIWNCPTLAVHLVPRTDALWVEWASLLPPDIFERYKKMYPEGGSGRLGGRGANSGKDAEGADRARPQAASDASLVDGVQRRHHHRCENLRVKRGCRSARRGLCVGMVIRRRTQQYDQPVIAESGKGVSRNMYKRFRVAGPVPPLPATASPAASSDAPACCETHTTAVATDRFGPGRGVVLLLVNITRPWRLIELS